MNRSCCVCDRNMALWFSDFHRGKPAFFGACPLMGQRGFSCTKGAAEMTQTEQIRAHLLKHNSITPMEALQKFKCFRLAARIHDLKERGFSVQTVMVERHGKHFAKYVMG